LHITFLIFQISHKEEAGKQTKARDQSGFVLRLPDAKNTICSKQHAKSRKNVLTRYKGVK